MYFNLPAFEKYLDTFLGSKRLPDKHIFKLQTMRLLCDYFGHPERACPCFHVAGSKGKGTISSDIAAILRSQGYTTGVYASPHAYHFTERVSTGETSFPPEIYAQAFTELRAGIDELTATHVIDRQILTWFEIVTLFAMLVFRLAKVDYAVYEVGMGGRLDATNIITPIAIAMGPIELEHTKYLGDTLAKIATEKAGIFKEKVPIFSAPQPPAVQAVFKNQATKNHADLHYITNISDYQVLDAEIAISTVRSVFPSLDSTKARSVALSTHLPGRYEIIKNCHGVPCVLLDGAHTLNSVRAILHRMQKEHIGGHLIFACTAKNIEQISREIIGSRLFDQIYLTRPGIKNADVPHLETAFLSALSGDVLSTGAATQSTQLASSNIHASSDYIAIIKAALSDAAATGTPLIAFGSFYLLPEVKKML